MLKNTKKTRPNRDIVKSHIRQQIKEIYHKALPFSITYSSQKAFRLTTSATTANQSYDKEDLTNHNEGHGQS